MSLSNLIRWGALSALTGGVLFAALFAAGLLVESGVLGGAFFESHWGYHSLDAPVNALLATGVLGLYLWQRKDFGKLGKAGFCLAFGGFALAALGGLAIIAVELAVAEGATPEWLDSVTHMLAMLLFVAGSIIFGAATYRAKVLTREGALLLVVGPLCSWGCSSAVWRAGFSWCLPYSSAAGSRGWVTHFATKRAYRPARLRARARREDL